MVSTMCPSERWDQHDASGPHWLPGDESLFYGIGHTEPAYHSSPTDEEVDLPCSLGGVWKAQRSHRPSPWPPLPASLPLWALGTLDPGGPPIVSSVWGTLPSSLPASVPLILQAEPGDLALRGLQASPCPPDSHPGQSPRNGVGWG